jgi:hypothetical protein
MVFLETSGVDVLAAGLAHLHDVEAGQVGSDVPDLVVALLANVASVNLNECLFIH